MAENSLEQWQKALGYCNKLVQPVTKAEELIRTKCGDI